MLNAEQKKAVEEISKPLIITAGPGTGKTFLIAQKISYLISQKNISQDEILAITFTKKATVEMSERVELETNKPFIAKTFHQFCQEIIEKYQKYIPQIDQNHTLINQTNSLIFFLENFNDFKFSSVEVKNNQVLIANELNNTISKLKDFGISLIDLEKLKCDDIQTKMDVFMAYSKYELFKKKNNFLDFGDLLLYTKELLEKYDKIKTEIQEKYKYILVDEYQDTNKIQFEIISMIAKDNNITIVGDSKQSIYAFRGASYDIIQDFKTRFKNTQEIYLTDNYRSSKSVIDIINKIIQNLRLPKEILNCKNIKKGDVIFAQTKNEKSQLTYLAKKINDILEKDKNATIGVLFRRKAELKVVSDYLRDSGIKFNSVHSENFFSLEIVKTILNECRVILNPKETNKELFELLLDLGIRPLIVQRISRASSMREKSIYEILSDETIVDSDDEREIIKKFVQKINYLIDLKNSKTTLYNLVKEIVFKFNNYQKALLVNDTQNIVAISNFFEFLKEYLRVYKNHNLENFLLVCSHSSKLDLDLEYKTEDKNKELLRVNLMTVHASKGKEFDYVFLPYLNERKFPVVFRRSKFEIFNEENKQNFIEEEKRLFFVALSRSKTELHLTYVKHYGQNKLDSEPSIFLKELNLNPLKFDEEIDSFKLTLNEEIKIQIINKIKNFLLENEFDKATHEIDLLKGLFDKKDLNFFLKHSSHPDYNFYNDKLESKNEMEENINFDAQSQIFSVSQLKTYESCPKKYLFSYIYKIPTDPKHYFDFGTSLHSVLEVLVDEIDKYSKEILFARGVEMLKRSWISKGYTSASQEKEYFEKGVESIRKFIEKELEVRKTGSKTINTEEKFLIDFEGKKILGFIDRIDKKGNEYTIIDYKTSNTMETEEQLKDNLQLYVYAQALKKNHRYNKFPESVGLWYLIYDKIVNVKLQDINMVKCKEKVLNLMSEIEKKNFKATPSYFSCKFCDFNKICPESLEKD